MAYLISDLTTTNVRWADAMSNIVRLCVCLGIGMLLRAFRRLPDSAPATINGFIINMALPALVLEYVHGTQPKLELLSAALMRVGA
jgi:malate permease and related proteins